MFAFAAESAPIDRDATPDAAVDALTSTAAGLTLTPASPLAPQHMIVIDVDCKDMSVGLSFPPKVTRVHSVFVWVSVLDGEFGACAQ